jgi:hypothetical protein
MTKRNKSPPETYRKGMLYLPDHGDRRLPLFKLLFDHQRWLNSNGRFGERFGSPEPEPGLLFYYCDLDGVDLSKARLEGAYFEGGSLRGARFAGVDLIHATFESCDVEGADFSGARLDWATLATNHEKACFDGASCDHVVFTMEERLRNRRLFYKLADARFKLIEPNRPRPGRKNEEPSP